MPNNRLLGFILTGLCLFSCKFNERTTDGFNLRNFLFVYDTLAIDYNSHPRVDTLLSCAFILPEDYSSNLVYVVGGDCSVCISAALSFLQEYQSLDVRPELVVILKSFSSEIFDFYYDQYSNSMSRNLPSRQSLKVICDDTCFAEDGVYLIISNRVIRYASKDILQGPITSDRLL